MKEFTVIIMYSEELKRDVKIYVSLPKRYNKEDKYYPVLYATDGQVLFNDYDEFKGQSWGIMNDYMNDSEKEDLIIVGIGSNESRNDELLPFTFTSKRDGSQHGGKATQLMNFIIHTVKPVIDDKYRTLSTPDKTGILGMSVGGVFSTFAASKYTNTFSRFASISTAFMPVHEKMLNHLKESDFNHVSKLYLDVGTIESKNENVSVKYVSCNQEVYSILKDRINPNNIRFELIQDGKHEEEDWNSRFSDIIDYLFS